MKKKIKLKGRIKFYILFCIYLGILLCIVDVAMFFVDMRAGMLLAGYIVVYFAITLFLYFHNKPAIMSELVSFATEYGQVQRKLLRDMDFPYALLDDNGKVIWTNIAFETIVHQSKGYKKSITSLFPTITKDRLPGGDSGMDEVQYELEYEGNEYVLKLKKISLEEMAQHSEMIDAEGYSGYLVAVYLYDETALHIAIQEVDDQSLAVGMVYLDNYDEALESVEEVRRSLLTALIDRKVNKYISAVDGICKKLEKDKYLIIMRKRAVAQLQETRFDLLEDVKTVNIGNEMAVTISVGIGVDGLTYAQNYEFARNAIDLALGRGGDQAVVKTSESITYYGGKSQQVEKNTRVKARVKALAFREIITGKDQVLVMGHRMPDADSFGAAVGIYRIALTLGRKAHIVLNDAAPGIQPMVERFKNNPDYGEMIIGNQQAIEMAGNNVVLVVVDVNRPSITECPDLLRFCKSVVVLDHHRQGTETIENATLSYVEPYASSACEMVSEILQYIYDNIRIRPEEADSMYSGIMIDTNNFMERTGVRTFEAAAFLRRNGADVTRVRKLFREDALEYKAKADAVSQAEIYKQYFAISICTADELPSPTIIGAQAANELLNIKGVKASFVLTDYQGKIYISARSIDEVNVQIIMERMGGGGHLSTAACQMEGVGIIEAMGALKRTIDSMLEANEI